GPDGDRRSQALRLARQLRSSGRGVAAVAGVFGDDPVPGSRALERFPDLPAAGDAQPEPHVVFSAGLPGAAARHLVGVTGGHAVPVIVGDVPPGRWCIRAGAGGDEPR
ncbi:hypothetical protein ACFQ0D_30825, partial [Micromonospora zhanjiangensis]